MYKCLTCISKILQKSPEEASTVLSQKLPLQLTIAQTSAFYFLILRRCRNSKESASGHVQNPPFLIFGIQINPPLEYSAVLVTYLQKNIAELENTTMKASSRLYKTIISRCYNAPGDAL